MFPLLVLFKEASLCHCLGLAALSPNKEPSYFPSHLSLTQSPTADGADNGRSWPRKGSFEGTIESSGKISR